MRDQDTQPPVTATGTDSAGDASRNGIRGRQRLAQELDRVLNDPLPPFVVAYLGQGDEQVARSKQVANLLHRAAYCCTWCDRVFVAGDTVYRKFGVPGQNMIGRQPLGAFCAECVGRWHPSWQQVAADPVPCEGGCGVLVSHWHRTWWGDLSHVAPTTCSAWCAEQARNLRRRMPPAASTCAECGGPLPPGSRADRRYCKDACRVSAHRKRRAT